MSWQLQRTCSVRALFLRPQPESGSAHRELLLGAAVFRRKLQGEVPLPGAATPSLLLLPVQHQAGGAAAAGASQLWWPCL